MECGCMKITLDKISTKGLCLLALHILLSSSAIGQNKWRNFAELAEGRHHHAARYLNGD